MQNKTRSWTDIQLIISSISIALTLGLWGLMASREKGVAAVRAEATLPIEPLVAEPPTEVLRPGETLYLGSAAPPAPVTVVQTRSRNRGGGGGGGGSGGGGNASTGSS